jgi:hypothetical protein
VIRSALAAVAVALAAASGFAQDSPPPAAWPSPLPISAGESPAAVVPSGLPERPPPIPVAEPRCESPGQQHWVLLNLSIFQPMIGRVGVKVWPRPNDSVWVEAYAGSVLFELMYGFGVRVQHTARTNTRGDALMIAPGLGVHIVPYWDRFHNWRPTDPQSRGGLHFLAADVDISWLHDFTPHCGYEIGVKLGLGVRVAGTTGSDYPSAVMFGPDVYPILNVYSGLRF